MISILRLTGVSRARCSLAVVVVQMFLASEDEASIAPVPQKLFSQRDLAEQQPSDTTGLVNFIRCVSHHWGET